MTDQLDRLKAALADRYKLERQLGVGGMATVYLAHDVRHDRKVAVKVLRPELAAVIGAERFLNEIKVTANLQHPHILPLHDSGEADSFLYYVMPFVEGESLRDKLNREKQLPVDESVEITKAVAGALDYAHRHDVIHRDIKPENILLHDEQPVVADFGIALAVSAADGKRLTETGISLGTPHYMSPEQVTGERELTGRSDLYSLGCVTYEMLVGEPPYTGPTAQAIIAKVLSEKPSPISQTRDLVPANVDAAVQKALAKSAADRFSTAAQFADALTNPAFTLPTTQTAVVGAPAADWRLRLAVPLATIAILVALWGWLRAPPEVPQLVARFSLRFPEGEVPQPEFGPSFAWSPDGARFVYSGEGTQLWVRERDQLSATALSGVIGRVPVFSPNGQAIAYTRVAVMVASIMGGQPRTLIETTIPFPWTLDWESGYIYFQSVAGLARIPDEGGELEQVLPPDTSLGAGFHFWIDVLPNGQGALTITGASPEQSTVGIVDFETGVIDSVMAGVYARYATSGHIVVVQSDGTVLAAPFDQDALELTGVVVPLLEGVAIGQRGGAQLALSQNGDLLYRRGEAAVTVYELVWVTPDGTFEEIDPGWSGNFASPRLSPDGKQLAVTINANTEQQIWIKQLDQGPLPKLTVAGSVNYRPAWTPDGRSVAFVSVRGNTGRDVYMRRADGSAPAQMLLDEERDIWEVTFSPDGEWLVYRVGADNRDLYALRVGVDSVVALVATEYREITPAVSPDGRWLAYASNESGRYEVYVRPFPNTKDGKWPISTDGATEPVWAHSGRELFYKENGNLMSVKVLPGPTFVTGERRVLFSLQGVRSDYNHQLYDVTPDDQRFVMVRLRSTGEAGELIMVENFFEELKAKVGN